MQAVTRRGEVTKIAAVVGSGEKVATDKVRELEILVDGKRFEEEWNKPVTFSFCLHSATRYSSCKDCGVGLWRWIRRTGTSVPRRSRGRH